MSDLLFGWFLGVTNVIVPLLLLTIWRLKRQVKFFTKGMMSKDEKFGWLKSLYGKGRGKEE